MLTPESPWLLSAFAVLWVATSAGVSLFSGWHELAERFKSSEPLEGQNFRFRSAELGWKWFPVGYRGILFATVSSQGLAISVFPLFGFMHPRLVIPWSAVDRCEEVRSWFGRQVAVHVRGFNRRLMFPGTLGAEVLKSWSLACAG